MTYQLNIKEVTYALSEALDLVGIDDTMHGKRVAYMAAEIAKELKYSQNLIDDIIFIGMLHDCGVSSTDVHNHLVNELDWDNAQVHSDRGYNLLSNTNTYKKFALAVKYHHTHWDSFDVDVKEDVKNIANLIYLADRVDALRAQMKHMGVKTTKMIQETILNYSGEMFSPEFVDTFMCVSSKGSFWFYLEEESLEEYYLEWVSTGKTEEFSFEEIRELSLMFAYIVDAKSTFTSEHSLGVASLSKHLAELFKLPKDICEKIELAGLLHDLGKLRVDDAILNKPSALNADEILKMNRHGFDSDIILRRIKGFKEIAHIASLHHETLDAKGYPYSLEAKDIPFEARILSIADIFQALIQERPYRKGLSAEKAYDIIFSMFEAGKLDGDIVKKLKENLESCYQYAVMK